MQQVPVHHENSVLRIGNLEVRFYVREPSPDNWNAIGVIGESSLVDHEHDPEECRMIVGTGPSRDDAIGDLIARVVSGQHPVLRRYRMSQLASV